MASTTTLFESDSFNRRFVEKLVEQRDRFLRGDELSVWQQIALELSQDWELDCGDLRWQDLSRYFKRSLVLKLNQHRKWTTDQGLIDRLQYPYLRKVYVVTIQFYDRDCPVGRKTDNSQEIEDNKLFIKYTMDGRYDPDVVSAFKRRSRKGARIYVNINVGDPVYNLPDDVKKLLLQMEHHRKERPHRKADSNEREGSPAPVAIEDGSPPPEKIFSPRDLLEKESFSVNTQEYDEIIKESLEREWPPVPKRRRMGSIKPGSVEVWLESCEILSPATSMVFEGQDDPLHISTRSSGTKRAAEGLISEPQFNRNCGLEKLAAVRSQPPTLIMASQKATLSLESIHIKQEPESEPASDEPTLEATHDPFLNNILAESDNDEAGDLRNSIVNEPLEASRSEAIIQSRIHEPLAAVRSQPPTLIVASQPSPAKQDPIQIKQESEMEALNVALNLEACSDPILDSILSDSDDEDNDDSNPRNAASNHNYSKGAQQHIPSRSGPLAQDATDPSDGTLEQTVAVKRQSPTTIVAASQKAIKDSAQNQQDPELNGTSTSKVEHDPFFNDIFTDSDEDEEEEIISRQILDSVPDNTDNTSTDVRHSSTTKEISIPKETMHSETTQNASLVSESNIPSQAQMISSNSKAPLVDQPQHCTSGMQRTSNPLEVPSTAPRNSTVDRLGIQVLDNSLISVPLHFIVKQRLPLAAPVDSTVRRVIEQPNGGSSETEATTEVQRVADIDQTKTKTQSSSDHRKVILTKTTSNAVQTDRQHLMEVDNSALRTERFHINIPVGSQSPNVQVYMNVLRRYKSQSPSIQPSPRCAFSRIQYLAEDCDPSGHSYQSIDSNRLVIAWSPNSTTSDTPKISTALEPPKATSPTAPKFLAEQYDSIQPSIESRLRVQAVLRSLWPELFARGDDFCDFLHLMSVLALNIFPRLHPKVGRAAMALLRMVSPIASRLAFGSYDPEAENSETVCSTDEPFVEQNEAKNKRDTSEVQNTNSSMEEMPLIVISDDDGEQSELPVRLKRHYHIHQSAPSPTDE